MAKRVVDKLTIGEIKKRANALIEDDRVLPTGSLFLDAVLGGGIPIGRITSIYGKTDSGKTTLSLLICRQAIKAGLRVLYIHTENKLTKSYMYKSVGIDPSTVDDNTDEIFLPFADNTYEVVRGLVHDVLNTQMFDFIVIDTISHLAVEEAVKSNENIAYGGIAKGVNEQFRIWANLMRNRKRDKPATMIVVSQTRPEMNSTYAQDKKAIAGTAVEFSAMVDIKMLRISNARSYVDKRDDERVGYDMYIDIEKAHADGVRGNSLAFPIVKIIDGSAHFDVFEEMYEVLTKTGDFVTEDGKAISKKNQACYYNGIKLSTFNVMRDSLIEQPELFNELVQLAQSRLKEKMYVQKKQ